MRLGWIREWISELTQHWKRKKVAECCQIKRRNAYRWKRWTNLLSIGIEEFVLGLSWRSQLRGNCQNCTILEKTVRKQTLRGSGNLPLQIGSHANRNTKLFVNLVIRKFLLRKNLRNVPSSHFRASIQQQRRLALRKVRIFLLCRTGSFIKDACAPSMMLSAWF